MGTTTSKSLVAPVSLVEQQDMVLMEPPTLGFLQYHEVPVGSSLHPPKPGMGDPAGNTPVTPSSTLAQPQAGWPLSEPPPWGQVPWG